MLDKPKRAMGTTLQPLDSLEVPRFAGMRIIDFEEYEVLGRDKAVEEIRRVAGAGPVYVTFDMDALDPAHCPGTGAPEPGGFSMRDAQVMIRSLAGLNIIGADVCEISPPLDPQGITALNASNIMFELLCVRAQALVTPRERAKL